MRDKNFTRAVLHCFCTVLLIPVLVACGSANTQYQAQNLPDEIAQQSDEYRIGPGDSVQIFVWDHPDLSLDVQVRPDGEISTPLVEDLQAAGKTPTELARDIEIVLSEYVRSPVVTVIMQEFQGEAEQQVRIVGQAVEPQAVPYREGMTVLDLVISVGGLSEFAAGNRAKIVRKTAEGDIDIKVRLKDLINDGDTSQNVRIRPGDVLIIPQSIF